MSEFKGYLLSLLSAIAFLLVVVIGINYYVDPANQFSHAHSVESRVARALLHKKNVVGLKNYNERDLQEIMLSKLNYKPDVLVLGSSRVMGLKASAFPGMSFYNAGVSGASLKDDIALYYLFQKRGWQPKLVILGLDPWLLSAGGSQTRWESLSDAYSHACQLLDIQNLGLSFNNIGSWSIKKYTELVSWGYFTASVKELYSKPILLKYYDQRTPQQEAYVKQWDGTLLNPLSLDQLSGEEADIVGTQYVQNYPAYSLGNFVRIDPDLKSDFNLFVQFLLGTHIKVVFYLPPYERMTYRGLIRDKRYQQIFVAEKFFNHYAKQYGIAIIGGYNPKHSNLRPSNFVDGMHMKANAITALFRRASQKILYHK